MDRQLRNPCVDIDMSSVMRQNDVDLRIMVLAFKRPTSLKGLLESIEAADYMHDKVILEIWIDMLKSGNIHEPTYTVAKNFKFKKGVMRIINQTRHVGIYGQWMGIWQPSLKTKEIGIFLEEDLSVSRYFYRYLKNVHQKYDKHEKINGYALQCSMKHGGATGKLHAAEQNVVFTYPIIGTWGFSPSNRNWLNFTNWYKLVYSDPNFRPFVPGILPTSWYKIFLKSGKTDTMWSMWHIFYAWKNNEVTVYPNLKHCDGFTIHWKAKGLHYNGNNKMTDRLINQWDNRLDSLPEHPLHLDANGYTKPSVIGI